ncbi:MAG TPA: hypothetical protein VJ718_06635 [Candidatus Binataceae bacterium]|nr:hypothetical protein [Candidatus Binataceae bacterium]
MSSAAQRPSPSPDGLVAHPLRTLMGSMVDAGRGRLAAIAALVAALPLLEAAGAALLLPALSAAGMDSGAASATTRYTRMIERGFSAARLHPGFAALLAAVGVVMAARGATERARSVATWALLFRLQDRLRRRLYRAIAGSGWMFVIGSRSSDFVHALTSELDRSNWAAAALIALAGETLVGALFSR